MTMDKKLTLEQRITRLEKLLKDSSKKKFESFESDFDLEGARAAADRIAKQFGDMIGEFVKPDRYSGGEVILSPKFGWLTADEIADEIDEDPDARFAFHYALGNSDFSFDVFPSDGTINLISEDGYSVSPSGEIIYYDEADLYASPLSDWRGFDLSMVEDLDEDTYVDLESYSRRRSRKESRVIGRKFSKNEAR